MPAAYVWLGLTPVPVLLSPKFQAYDAMVPSVSFDPLASKVAVKFFDVAVNDAVGRMFAAATVIGFVTVPVAPELSVTVNVTL